MAIPPAHYESLDGSMTPSHGYGIDCVQQGRGMSGVDLRLVVRGAFALAITGTVSSAYAMDEVQTDMEAHSVSLVGSGDGASILVSGPDAIQLWSADLEKKYFGWSFGGARVSKDASGRQYGCSSNGVFEISFEGGSFSMTSLTQAPCEDLVVGEAESGRLLVVKSRDVLKIYDEASGWRPDTWQALDGREVLLAGDGAVAGAVVSGSGKLLLLEGGERSEVPFSDNPTALNRADGAWLYTAGDPPELRMKGRESVSVLPGTTRLATGDLDSDGQMDVVLLHPQQAILGMVPGGEQIEFQADLPEGVVAMVVGDGDADPCHEVWVVTEKGLIKRIERPCPVDASDMASAPGSAEMGHSSASDPASPDSSDDAVAQTLVVGGAIPPRIRVKVGETARYQLIYGAGIATGFSAYGAPQGMLLTNGGMLEFTPEPGQLGEHVVGVRLFVDGSWSRRASFRVSVVGDYATVTPPTPKEKVEKKRDLDKRDALRERAARLQSELGVRGCVAGGGGVLGVSDGQSWVTLGQGPLVSASPAVAAMCDAWLSRKMNLSAFAGFDFAPMFMYIADGVEFRHGLTATLGAMHDKNNLGIGGYVTGGFTLAGAGALVRWMPAEVAINSRGGIEFRATWLAAPRPAAQAMLLLVVQMGDYKNREDQQQ